MPIDPSTDTYGTADLVRNTAVQDVDVQFAGPAGQTSAKAQVVVAIGVAPSGDALATEAKQDAIIALLSGAATGAVTSVDSAAADTLILAENANRKGSTIANTDDNPLRLLLSTGVASAVNFTVSVASGGYYEVPFGYTGEIRGIWDADGTGAALVTEFS